MDVTDTVSVNQTSLSSVLIFFTDIFTPVVEVCVHLVHYCCVYDSRCYEYLRMVIPQCTYLQTFREKKKNIAEGTTRFDLHKRANASLHSGIDLKQVVKLPPDEEVNDWIAVHGN